MSGTEDILCEECAQPIDSINDGELCNACIEKLQDKRNTMNTKQNFNDSYIVASQNKREAYQIIINAGVICGQLFDWDATYWFIKDNLLKHSNIEYILHCGYKQFYINNKALSWDEPKDCKNCRGSGYIMGNACSICNGTGEKTIKTKQETISIKDGDKEYVFEKPEYKCELLKVNKLGIIASLKIDNEEGEDFVLFSKDGQILQSLDGYSYDSRLYLTPIKPNWYEDESNFKNGALLVDELDGKHIVYSKTMYEDLAHHSGFKVRLATQSEAQSLYYEDKAT